MPFDIEAARAYCSNPAMMREELQDELRAACDEIERLRERPITYSPPHEQPVPMRIPCPSCSTLHIDEGEFATKPHHTHACQACGAVWRPAIVPTVGVRFLPGFQNKPEKAAHRWDSPRCPRNAICVHDALCPGAVR